MLTRGGLVTSANIKTLYLNIIQRDVYTGSLSEINISIISHIRVCYF